MSVFVLKNSCSSDKASGYVPRSGAGVDKRGTVYTKVRSRCGQMWCCNAVVVRMTNGSCCDAFVVRIANDSCCDAFVVRISNGSCYDAFVVCTANGSCCDAF